jgi:hypothetical protein
VYSLIAHVGQKKRTSGTPPPCGADRAETATTDHVREPDPSPHHRDVLADPSGQRARLSATLAPRLLPPPAKYLCNEPTIKASSLDLSQTTLICTRTSTPSPLTARSTTVQDTISIRLGTAPLSTPLVVDCETLVRAEGAGQWWRGTLESGGRGFPSVLPPCTAKLDGLGLA